MKRDAVGDADYWNVAGKQICSGPASSMRAAKTIPMASDTYGTHL